MNNLTAEQKKLVDEILKTESQQRKVDEIIAATKLKLTTKALQGYEKSR